MIGDFGGLSDDLRRMADLIDEMDYSEVRPADMEEILLYMSLRDMVATLADSIDRILPPEYQREVVR